MTEDSRLQAPAAARNRGPILEVLKPYLPTRGLVLEVASGSGEHVVHFAQSSASVTFQPSDPDASARASIDSWVASLGLANVRPALALCWWMARATSSFPVPFSPPINTRLLVGPAVSMSCRNCCIAGACPTNSNFRWTEVRSVRFSCSNRCWSKACLTRSVTFSSDKGFSI